MWTKGGSQIATGVNPTATLSTGSHTITLTVTDDSAPSLTDTDEVKIVIASGHAVNSPSEPSGSPSGEVDELLEFSTSKSTCSKGHPVEYQFNWDWDPTGEGDLSKWSSSTSASHRYSKEGTYQVKARARCAIDILVKSGWSAAKIVTIGPPPDEHAPTADASDIDIGDVSETMYANTFCTVTAKYYDADGRDNLKNCCLRINRPPPVKALTMTWYQADGDYRCDVGEGGERYLTISKVRSTKIPGNPEGYELAWTFKISDEWPEVDNAIDFGVFAEDDGDLESGWHYDDSNASFMVEKIATVTGRVTDSSTAEGIVGAILLLDPDPLIYCPGTSSAGYFSFSAPAGTYDITASAEDYESQTKRVMVTAGEPTEVNFDLSSYTRVPVIIIPGIAGSYLEKLSGDLIWNPDNWGHCAWELKTDKCLRDPGCPVTSYDIGHHHYELLWKALKDEGYSDPVRLLYPFSKSQDWTGADLFLFCYDWRQDLVVIAAHLRWAIEWILEHSSAPHIDIVAHSMGGLVARCYINRSNETANSVRKLLLLGTPNYGTTSAYLLLHPELGCYNAELKLSCQDFIAGALKDLPGPYQLLPTAKFFRDLYPYVFIDSWAYSAPGELHNAAEEELRSWELTYKINPDSRLVELDLVEQARSRHEDTLGETLRFDGEVYLFVGTDLGTPHYVTKEGQVIYTSPPSSSTPAVRSVTHWDIYLENGDKRVLARSAAWLEVESNAPQKCIFTVPKADHAGELIKSSGVLNLIREVLSNPYSLVACSLLGGRFEPPDFPPQKYDKIRLSSPATLSVYNLDGELLAGPSEDCDCFTITKDTDYFVLENTKIAIVPDGLAYSVKIVGTGEGTFTLELNNCRGDITLSKYIFSDIPTTSNTIGSTTPEPGAARPPQLDLDLDGDGTIDQTVIAQEANTPIGQHILVCSPLGNVELVFHEVRSAGETSFIELDRLPFAIPSLPSISELYGIWTTAFYETVEIRIHYDDSGATADQEHSLQLFKITGDGDISTITTSLDTNQNIITGMSESLSFFAVGYGSGMIPYGVVVGPNPVPDTGTAFFYSLPVGTSTAKLMVFSATSGRLLFETSIDVNETRFPAAGTWDPVDNDGVKLANGPYLYVLIANGQLIGQGKMVIQR